MVGRTRSASVSEASSTRTAPLANSGARSRASSRASRLLPLPPAPVSDTRRTSGRASSARSSSSSRRRPTRSFGGSGRLAPVFAVTSPGIEGKARVASARPGLGAKRAPVRVPPPARGAAPREPWRRSRALRRGRWSGRRRASRARRWTPSSGRPRGGRAARRAPRRGARARAAHRSGPRSRDRAGARAARPPGGRTPRNARPRRRNRAKADRTPEHGRGECRVARAHRGAAVGQKAFEAGRRRSPRSRDRGDSRPCRSRCGCPGGRTLRSCDT